MNRIIKLFGIDRHTTLPRLFVELKKVISQTQERGQDKKQQAFEKKTIISSSHERKLVVVAQSERLCSN